MIVEHVSLSFVNSESCNVSANDSLEEPRSTRQTSEIQKSFVSSYYIMHVSCTSTDYHNIPRTLENHFEVEWLLYYWKSLSSDSFNFSPHMMISHGFPTSYLSLNIWYWGLNLEHCWDPSWVLLRPALTAFGSPLSPPFSQTWATVRLRQQ